MALQADVVVPVFRGLEETRACLESVLKHSGGALRKLIIVDDRGPEPEMKPMLEALRAREAAVRLISNEENLGFVESCNRGLSLREGHAVVLNSDTRVTAGWLDQLLEVLEDDGRIAAVVPLTNNGGLATVPDVEARAGELKALPLWTEVPTGVGFCLLFRGQALDGLGLFDPIYGQGYNEENDWCQRARAKGHTVALCNRAFVFHSGEVSFQGVRADRDVMTRRVLQRRYPRYAEDNARFEASPAGRAAARMVRQVLGQPLKVSAEEAEVRQFAATQKGVQVVSAEDADVVHHVLRSTATRESVAEVLKHSGALVVSCLERRIAGERSRWTQALLRAADVVVVPTLGDREVVTTAAGHKRVQVAPMAKLKGAWVEAIRAAGAGERRAALDALAAEGPYGSRQTA